MADINEEKQILIPDKESATKQAWVSFYNEGAAEVFEAYKQQRKPGDEHVFQAAKQLVNCKFRRVSEETGLKVTIQRLQRCLPR